MCLAGTYYEAIYVLGTLLSELNTVAKAHLCASAYSQLSTLTTDYQMVAVQTK